MATRKDAAGFRVFGARFVDSVKSEGTPEAYEKSRLVVQGFNDDHDYLTHAPTVQRASQRLLLALCVCDPEFYLKTRDVSQANVQSTSKIRRQIFVLPPRILGFPPDVLFRVNRPLYGIPEAGIHWYKTYHTYHKHDLKMSPSVYDPCLLSTKASLAITSGSRSTPRGIVCLKTDDTAYIGNKAFFKLEEQKHTKFDSKEAQLLTSHSSIKFNGAVLSQQKNRLFLSQPDHIRNLNKLDETNFTSEEFVTERARGSYISGMCRPKCTYGFCHLSQVTTPSKRDVKLLNKVMHACTEDPERGLRFFPLDLESMIMGVFLDAGFATNSDMTSQLGFVVALMDKSGNGNVVHYASTKSKRVTRSVLAAELFAMVQGFDDCSVLRLTLNDILGRVIPMHVYTDSRSLYDCLTNINRTREKRLLIDLCMLRESYERREISEVFWIPTAQNPADAFT